MERVHDHDSGGRIVPLSAALSPPAPMQEVSTPIAAPDPATRLREEAERMFQAAREQGLVEGRARAEAEVREACEQAQRAVRAEHAAEQARLEAATQDARRLLESLAHGLAALEHELQDAVVEVAYASVLRILGAVAADEDMVRALCRQALSEVAQRPAVLRLHPDDAESAASLAQGDDVRVEADNRLARGQCRLQTRRGDYDTSLADRLETLRLALLDGLDASRQGS
jgi:flagellar biosynthesis/type III secretory pathway protein FliH